MNAQSMIGNLAWASLSSLEEIEVLDRFNGVPTLGVFGTPGQKILFWRALGYVPPHQISLWLYVPLADEDETHLEAAEPSELLQGLIFNSRTRRKVTVCLSIPSLRRARRKPDEHPRQSANLLSALLEARARGGSSGPHAA